MSIVVSCACGQDFETDDENAGKHTRCPVCGRVLRIPWPARPQDEIRFIPPEPEPEPEPARISRTAMASLAVSLLFPCVCISGMPAIMLGIAALDKIALSRGRVRGRKMAIAGIVLGVIDCFLSFVLPVTESRAPARRAQCINNLKQISLAMHEYHSAYGCLPPAAITDAHGRPLLSWRVAILPFMESSNLYSQFHLDEPWDSPHNLALIDQMPMSYACPSDRSPRLGMTNYQAVVGPRTAFTPDFTPLTFADFTDGTSNTLLIGESRRLVHWTKPEDLSITVTAPLFGVGSDHGSGFNAVFADGHARFFKEPVRPGLLWALLTRNGREVIDADDQ